MRGVVLALGLAQVWTPGGAAAATDARLDGGRVVSESPAPETPHVMDGEVLDITQLGPTMVAVGTFTQVSPASTWSDPSDDLVRHGIVAFDAETGAIDPDFDPALRGPVQSVDTDGTHLYLAGNLRVAGSTAPRVVKLTAQGGVVPTFRARPNGRVDEVVVRGRRVFVGGAFTSIRANGRNADRHGLAALSRRTGAVLSSVAVRFSGTYHPRRGGRTAVKGFDVSADGRHLVAVGNFARVGGRPRVQVAVLDISGRTARVTRWASPRFDRWHNNCSRTVQTFVRDVELAPGDAWFAVVTTGGFGGGSRAGTLCDTVSRWPTSGRGRRPTWIAYTGGDTVNGLEVTSSAVYVGGHMRWMNNPYQRGQAGPGAVPRNGIAALDPANGVPLSWNPGRARGVGAQALFSTSRGLWVGSDTTQIGGLRRGRIAVLPWEGGTAIPVVTAATLPNELFLAPWTGGVLQRRPVAIDATPTGPATPLGSGTDWSGVRGAMLIGDTVYHGQADGGFYRRVFDPATGEVQEAQQVDLHDDPESGEQIPFRLGKVTGMFYAPGSHRIYYTVDGDERLLHRGFSPESQVVGAEAFVAAARHVDFSRTAGLTLAGRWLVHGSDRGILRRVRFRAGTVRNRPQVVSKDGSWRGRAIFVSAD